MIRGTGEAEKLLKNAKTELWNEYEEIANYIAIEELAKAVGDKDTEELARDHRRQEERMANFLTKLLPQLTKAVVTEEIPASERRKPTTRRRTTTRARSTSSRSTSSRGASSRTAASGRATGSRSSSRRSRSTAARSS
jgi:rubrerythrin